VLDLVTALAELGQVGLLFWGLHLFRLAFVPQIEDDVDAEFSVSNLYEEQER